MVFMDHILRIITDVHYLGFIGFHFIYYVRERLPNGTRPIIVRQ